MQVPFRRRSADPAAGGGAGLDPAADRGSESTQDASGADREAGASLSGARPRAYTPSKKDLGKSTPKRRIGGRPAEPPPANRREAMRRLRAKQAASRAEARAGMMAGKEEYLLARDKGPERATVRDIVDARRNIATYFLPLALIVVVASSQAMPVAVRYIANVMWIALVVGVILDSTLLSRRVKHVLQERFPKSNVSRRGSYWYAIMRSLSFRRMRVPSARVKVGTKI